MDLKRFGRIAVIVLVIAMFFAACGQGASSEWQEQYDLGMRYLEDGNYEEAIIAFEAAIEIDPMQAPAYLGMAEVYIAQNDFEAARDILQQGYDLTGDRSLKVRIDDIDSGALIKYNKYGAIEFEQRTDYCDFEKLDNNIKDIIRLIAENITIKSSEELTGILSNVDIEHEYYEVYSETNKMKIYFLYSQREEGGKLIDFEMRPQNGNGYALSFDEYLGDGWYNSCEIAVCECIEWQWNGEMQAVSYMNGYSGNERDVITHGQMVDSLRNGTFDISLKWRQDEMGNEYTRTYDAEGHQDSDNEGSVFGIISGYEKDMLEFLYW